MYRSAQILPFPMAIPKTRRAPNRLRELRAERGMTLEQVALEADCSIATVNAIEMGKRTLSLDWMNRFARVFGVTPAEIMTREGNPDALDAGEKALIEALRNAPKANRDALLGAAEHLIGYKPEPAHVPLPSSRKTAA
jgi:transcriptional regulator with XRE-family HTH domain